MAGVFGGGIFPGTCFQHLESRPVPAAQRLNRRLTTFSSASAPKFLSGRFKRACNVNAQVLCLPFFWQSALIWEWKRKRSAIVHPCRRHAAGFVQLRTPKRQCPGFCSTALNSRGSTVNAACPWAGRPWPWGRPGCGPRQRRTDACPYQRLRAALPQMLRLFCKPDFKD